MAYPVNEASPQQMIQDVDYQKLYNKITDCVGKKISPNVRKAMVSELLKVGGHAAVQKWCVPILRAEGMAAKGITSSPPSNLTVAKGMFYLSSLMQVVMIYLDFALLKKIRQEISRVDNLISESKKSLAFVEEEMVKLRPKFEIFKEFANKTMEMELKSQLSDRQRDSAFRQINSRAYDLRLKIRDLRQIIENVKLGAGQSLVTLGGMLDQQRMRIKSNAAMTAVGGISTVALLAANPVIGLISFLTTAGQAINLDENIDVKNELKDRIGQLKEILAHANQLEQEIDEMEKVIVAASKRADEYVQNELPDELRSMRMSQIFSSN